MVAAEVYRRPLYARALRLRQLNPGPVLCFILLEGSAFLGLLLALAELTSWWTSFVLPAAVAVMVKANDLIAVAVTKAALQVPEQEQERFRREVWLAADQDDEPCCDAPTQGRGERLPAARRSAAARPRTESQDAEEMSEFRRLAIADFRFAAWFR